MQTAGTVHAPAAGKRPRGRPRKTLDERDDGNRRRALLVGAARLFRRKGFDATSTRDIAAAAGMQSGSPFYHFKTKQALLFAVMEEGMRSALERQRQLLAEIADADPGEQLRRLVHNHFDVLVGSGSDFYPVMLYEARSITPRQRAQLADMRSEYEGVWDPVLRRLHDSGRLHADVKLARLLIVAENREVVDCVLWPHLAPENLHQARLVVARHAAQFHAVNRLRQPPPTLGEDPRRVRVVARDHRRGVRLQRIDVVAGERIRAGDIQDVEWPAAPKGEMDFVMEGAMIGGFALAAAPAQYRVTGVKTFQVGPSGIVYEKDLGEDTLKVFETMDRYNPDKS